MVFLCFWQLFFYLSGYYFYFLYSNDILRWHSDDKILLSFSWHNQSWPKLVILLQKYDLSWPRLVMLRSAHTLSWPRLVMPRSDRTLWRPTECLLPLEYDLSWPSLVILRSHYDHSWPRLVILQKALVSSQKKLKKMVIGQVIIWQKCVKIKNINIFLLIIFGN